MRIFILLLLAISTIACQNKNLKQVEEVTPVKINGDLSGESKDVKTTAGSTALQWLAIDDLEEASKGANKKVLVDVYTDWCGWCKVMDKKTFSDPKVIQYLNDNFHVVKFNAEQRDPIMYQGKEYKLVQAGRRGVNQLAAEMLNGRLGYPSLVYLDENLKKLKVSPGFKAPEQLLNELEGISAR